MTSEIFSVWFLMDAALVFWMQAGFAMVETGFTRAKNAGNILMKNLMDFCIGTGVFILIGFSFLLGEDLLGFIGKPGFDIFTNYANFDWSNFVFNLVFCATTATIVSGAMAERTKFLSYCIYSGVISALVYPIEAHWIWGGGWLSQLGSIFLTTTVAPAIATVTCMIFTWVKYGKPDVSMCLNASLAGLVAITAGCDVTDCLGAAIIGIVAGLLCPFGVWLLDYKLHVDDPVGAVAVHFCNGIWGTIAVGLFATTTAPGNDSFTGLFYGGGIALLAKQLLGVLTVCAWTAVTITIVFLLIRATVGLRVTREEEIMGLDLPEHGLANAYADFVPAINTSLESADLSVAPAPFGPAAVDEAVPVVVHHAPVKTEKAESTGVKMTKVEIVCKQAAFDTLKNALMSVGITGMTVTNVLGCGIQKGKPEYYRGTLVEANLLPKVQVEVVISKVPVRTVIETAKKALYTGHIGDGKIFVYDVENVIKVRTGEEGYDALQDVE